MEQRSVSIIVPVYNAEKTIERCVQSILEQTFIDFELVLVNDGSTDQSLLKLEAFKEDKRVTIIDKANEGASLSRNRGLDETAGRYILFIDSDDYVERDYIERLYQEMEDSQVDMVISGFHTVDMNGNRLQTTKLKHSAWAKYIITTPWARMIRKEVLDRHQLRFIDYTMEDIHFNAVFFSKTDRIRVIDYAGYNYVTNPESTTNTIHKGITKDVDILHILSAIHHEVEPTDIIKFFYRKVYLYYLLKSGRYAGATRFMEEYDRIQSFIREHHLESHMSPFNAAFEGESWRTRMIMAIFTLLEKCHLLPLFAKFYCKG